MYIVLKHSAGFAQIFVHYLFFNTGQVKLSMVKYLMSIYLSLGAISTPLIWQLKILPYISRHYLI